MPTQEPLLAASGVRLFGVEVRGSRSTSMRPPWNKGALPNRLNAAPGDPKLVRVYGFSFEGQYYDLARPTIYLVFGEGARDPCRQTLAAQGSPPTRLSWSATSVWTLDQSDFSLRLDIDVGPIERILVEMEIGPDQQRAPYAGQNVRSGYAGQNVRYAGQNARLRYAGQNARLQGGSSD